MLETLTALCVADGPIASAAVAKYLDFGQKQADGIIQSLVNSNLVVRYEGYLIGGNGRPSHAYTPVPDASIAIGHFVMELNRLISPACRILSIQAQGRPLRTRIPHEVVNPNAKQTGSGNAGKAFEPIAVDLPLTGRQVQALSLLVTSSHGESIGRRGKSLRPRLDLTIISRETLRSLRERQYINLIPGVNSSNSASKYRLTIIGQMMLQQTFKDSWRAIQDASVRGQTMSLDLRPRRVVRQGLGFLLLQLVRWESVLEVLSSGIALKRLQQKV